MQLAKVLPPKGVWQLQSTLHAFFQPRVLLPEDSEDTAVPLAGNWAPQGQPPSPTVATHAVVVDCQKKPSKRRPKVVQLAKPLCKHTARQKLEYLAYADRQWCPSRHLATIPPGGGEPSSLKAGGGRLDRGGGGGGWQGM